MADVLKKPGGNIASGDEQAALQRLHAALQAAQPPTLLGPDGQTIPIPQTIIELMRLSVDHLMQGDYVQLKSVAGMLTIQQAAEILNVSRQFMKRLLDQGQLPVITSGTRRHLRLADVLHYKEQRDIKERQGLAELARLSQEMGLYDQA
jgi:excisionase family DNA binding protein